MNQIYTFYFSYNTIYKEYEIIYPEYIEAYEKFFKELLKKSLISPPENIVNSLFARAKEEEKNESN